MPTNVYDSELSLAPGQVAYAGQDGDERIVIWPTGMDERSVVERIVDVLVADDDTAEWLREVVANMALLSVQEFMESDGSVLEDNSGVVRFNAGEYPVGFSVTAVINDGVRELQGVFGVDQDALASRVIESTIVASGVGRVSEIIQLGRAAQS